MPRAGSSPPLASQGLRWTDNAIEAVFALTDGHPLLVQAVCAGIWQRFAHSAPLRTVEREDLEGEGSLSLVLEETGDSLAQIWVKLPVAAEAVLMLIAQQGSVVDGRDLDAAVMSRRRWRRALRQACTDLRYAGFLVSEGDGVRCSPLLLGHWAQRQDLSRASELQQMVAATDQLPHARSRTRIKSHSLESHSHSIAPAPI